MTSTLYIFTVSCETTNFLTWDRPSSSSLNITRYPTTGQCTCRGEEQGRGGIEEEEWEEEEAVRMEEGRRGV